MSTSSSFKISIQSCWQWYKGCLQTAPLRTKCLTSGVIFGVGDVLAQKIENNPKINYERTLMMSSIGVFVITPQIHYWFKILDKTFVGTSTGKTLSKLAVDQFVFLPYIVSCNFAAVNLFKNRGRFDFDAYKNKLNDDLFPSIQRAWTIWPIVNFVLFKYVPIDNRLLISNLVSIYWNCYLSLMANKTSLNSNNNSIGNISSDDQQQEIAIINKSITEKTDNIM